MHKTNTFALLIHFHSCAVRDLRALTGLRFIAALCVLVFHLYKRGLLPPLPVRLANVVSQGALGVNMFFVLSGLLLTHSQLHDFPAPA